LAVTVLGGPTAYSTVFADARPLPGGVELHLPFPLLFARFNNPWQITAAATASQGVLTRPFALMHARGEPATDPTPPQLQHVLHRMHALGLDERDMLPTRCAPSTSTAAKSKGSYWPPTRTVTAPTSSPGASRSDRPSDCAWPASPSRRGDLRPAGAPRPPSSSPPSR